ncbi:hypothetical protein FSARC_8276 [Fusarium sarcochroum]|uniref:Xylanolytic transcriptional activator regulatory domain-containing protein n=1 Tax=Fusarium sarcochroum TaxID=1208366 RepID=A0A8H4TTK3_9HYPO|nr:hypothetical protein FSARC_8276 [Fusarium sarcochroum]
MLHRLIPVISTTASSTQPILAMPQPPDKHSQHYTESAKSANSYPAQSPEVERPQLHTLLFAADVYFRFCHNQPYSLFHEPTFRRRLKNDSLPDYLVWAFLSAARRFSSLPVAQLKSVDDASVYAARSWEFIKLPWDGTASPEEIVAIVQSIILIVSTENPAPDIYHYLAGLCSQAYMKLGFAARLALDSKLHLEPEVSMPIFEREERKRTFWSLYLQDKLISLSRGRFCVIRDEDCKLSLPCSEHAFKEGKLEQTPVLEDMTGDCMEQDAADSCCPLALIAIMASTLGRVSHYVLHETKNPQIGLPWSSATPYASLSAALLQAEHYFGINEDPTVVLKQRCVIDGVVDSHLAGSFIYAKAIFHLSHCLLHHPFLIQQRLQSFKQKAPLIFMKAAWEKCRTHAKSITDLRSLNNHNVLLLTSLYGYCAMVAGTIHALAMNDDRVSIREESQKSYCAALESLRDLSSYWGHAALMVKRLERFHNVDHSPADVKALWQSVDYTSLSTPTRPGSPSTGGENASKSGFGSSSDQVNFTDFGAFEGMDIFNNFSFFDGNIMIDVDSSPQLDGNLMPAWPGE